MGDKIKTAAEIAMERAAEIGELTPEEKEAIENKKKLEPILADFYRAKLGPNELWQKLKGSRDSLLRDAQLNLINSLSIGDRLEELQRRKSAILALETLKQNQKTSIVEHNLNLIKDLKLGAEKEKEQAFNSFKLYIEKNPQARLREIRQGNAKVIVELPVEKAIQQNPKWKQFLLEYERKYGEEFAKIIEKLKAELQS